MRVIHWRRWAETWGHRLRGGQVGGDCLVIWAREIAATDPLLPEQVLELLPQIEERDLEIAPAAFATTGAARMIQSFGSLA